MSRFSARVAGIPCQVEVVHYEPYDPGVAWGPPERCYPPEGGEIEVRLYDRKGYRARWLEDKLNDDEFAALTGWTGRTNQHVRDAVCVSWPYRHGVEMRNRNDKESDRV